MKTAFPGLITIAMTSAMAIPVESLATDYFARGNTINLSDLPAGNARSQLNNLPEPARQRALRWLQSFDFPAKDLEHLTFDPDGSVLYVDSHTIDEAPPLTDSGSALDIPANMTFKLHSKPDAAHTIYIDVNGHLLQDTAWNAASGVTTYNARAYSTDSDFNNFSQTELTNIQEIWHRIAEDFAPFDVNVTTEEPAVFDSQTGRILITSKTDANGQAMPHDTAGGVAYVGVWGASYYNYYSPALVYYDNLGGGFPPYVAEAASHEMGHNLGLSHDGTSGVGYYTGHGSGYSSWAPIMGVGYYQNVTQWSKGEYADANNKQDDLAIIANHLSYRSDDHGGISTPLQIEADGSVFVTTPQNNDPTNPDYSNKGIIANANDVDSFMFQAGAGLMTLNIEPAWAAYYRDSRRGANLDIVARLFNSNGNLITESQPVDETSAQISVELPAADSYMLSIAGDANNTIAYSNYGSGGQYFISGQVPVYDGSNDSGTGGDNGGNQPDPVYPPADPISIGATDKADGSAFISWIGDANADNYEIEREGQNKRNKWNGSTIVNVVTDTSYTDNAGAGTFRYRIRGTNSLYQSDFSSWMEVTITDANSSNDGGGNTSCKGKKCR